MSSLLSSNSLSIMDSYAPVASKNQWYPQSLRPDLGRGSNYCDLLGVVCWNMFQPGILVYPLV